MGTVKKRGKTWSLIYRMEIDGKSKQKWQGGFKTKKEAEQALIEIEYNLKNNTFIRPEKISVGEYLRDWFANHVENNLSPTSSDGYKNNIEKHIIPHIGDVLLQKLQPIQVQKMYSSLLKNGRVDGKAGLSEKSVLYIHRNLRTALQHAVRMQLVPRNVVDAVEPPKAKRFPASILSQDEIPVFLRSFTNTRIEIPVNFALAHGLRRGEALGLRWQDVDFKNKTITINQTVLSTNKGVIFNTPKTEKSQRQLMISETLVNLLNKHRREQLKLKFAIGSDYEDNDLVVCNNDGSPIDPAQFSKMFSKVLKDNNLKHMRFHDLRHTNATLMLRNKVPMKVASEILGHSKIGITQDLYTHFTTDMQEEVVALLEKTIYNTKEA